MDKLLIAFCLTGLACPVASATQATESLIVTTALSGGAVADPYTCQDTVYAYFTLPKSAQAQTHKLMAEWLRPDGARQDLAETSVALLSGEQKTVGFSLRFHPAEHSSVGRWPLSSSLGDTPDPFDGQWKLRLHFDQQTFDKNFKVRCSAHG